MAKIKILIIDDSALVRKLLTDILSKHPQFEVVGSASDPIFALKKIKRFSPDVLTLDIQMPKMDGLTFLKQLMRTNPIPTIMFSSLTKKNAIETVQALEKGAFDIIEKPSNINQINDLKSEFADKIILAAQSKKKLLQTKWKPSSVIKSNHDILQQSKMKEFSTRSQLLRSLPKLSDSISLIAIGASTGGTVAIASILSHLPINTPGVVIVQHMPAYFTAAFAARLNKNLPLEIQEAKDQEEIKRGHVYIAPGGFQCMVKLSKEGRLFLRVYEGETVNRHKPSVSVLFASVASQVKEKAIGVILTGMGADGAEEMLQMKQAGSYNIAQDEETSIVWGMPKRAIALKAENVVLPIDKIGNAIKFHLLKK